MSNYDSHVVHFNLVHIKSPCYYRRDWCTISGDLIKSYWFCSSGHDVPQAGPKTIMNRDLCSSSPAVSFDFRGAEFAVDRRWRQNGGQKLRWVDGKGAGRQNTHSSVAVKGRVQRHINDIDEVQIQGLHPSNAAFEDRTHHGDTTRPPCFKVSSKSSL